jgi:hypothetical protein
MAFRPVENNNANDDGSDDDDDDAYETRGGDAQPEESEIKRPESESLIEPVEEKIKEDSGYYKVITILPPTSPEQNMF